MKNLVLFLLFVGLVSCTDSKPTLEKSSEIITQDSLPELSVFNLPAEWKNQEHQTIKLADYQGKISVMVMIYTSCQAACPRLVADMRGIEKEIPRELIPYVNLIFVSIDPLVDTPENNKKFLKTNFLDQSHWHFLSGSLENTREFAMVLGVKYKQVSPIDFSHSNIISLFDENGVLVYQQSGLGADNQAIVTQLTAHLKRLQNVAS